MSRSGYHDDCDNWSLICWRGAVASAIRGKRGQAFLREMVEALDALPEKKLITKELVAEDGVCAIGSVCRKRQLDVADVDPEDREAVAKLLGISEPLAAEIAYLNDEWYGDTPEKRFARMREWACEHLSNGTPTTDDGGKPCGPIPPREDCS